MAPAPMSTRTVGLIEPPTWSKRPVPNQRPTANSPALVAGVEESVAMLPVVVLMTAPSLFGTVPPLQLVGSFQSLLVALLSQSYAYAAGQQTVTKVAVRAIPALRDQFRWFIRLGFMGRRQDRGE